jgi:uracil-DNA glycosylase
MVHASWTPVICAGLQAMHDNDPAYLAALATSATQILPSKARIFAAFAQPIEAVRFVLIGEGPYPREESATGVSFMDGAVSSLWSENGLSSKINRATSLRNFMKMLLVAEGWLDETHTTKDALQAGLKTAQRAQVAFIQTLAELEAKLHSHGFLLLNASLVYRSDVAPMVDAKAWRPMMRQILLALNHLQVSAGAKPIELILWGKIAEQLQQIPEAGLFVQRIAEHPYNLSFVQNKSVQTLFRPMHLLIRDQLINN